VRAQSVFGKDTTTESSWVDFNLRTSDMSYEHSFGMILFNTDLTYVSIEPDDGMHAANLNHGTQQESFWLHLSCSDDFVPSHVRAASTAYGPRPLPTLPPTATAASTAPRLCARPSCRRVAMARAAA
jgi:hypothetical protein